MLATDIDFGSDGKLYIADWVIGWQGVNKGRIYSYEDKEHGKSVEAQFELVARNKFDQLKAISLDKTKPTLARVHALFGLGQIARSNEVGELSFQWLEPVLQATDDQVVIAATRLYAEPVSLEPAWLTALLKHANARVRFAAAMGLADVGTSAEIPAVAEMLIENDNKDPMLRHAGIMVIEKLIRSANANTLIKN